MQWRVHIPGVAQRRTWCSARRFVVACMAVTGCGPGLDEPKRHPGAGEIMPWPDTHTGAPVVSTDHDASSYATDTCMTKTICASGVGYQSTCYHFEQQPLLSHDTFAGVSFADVDGDGRTDVYLLGAEGPNQLFINAENDTFRESSAQFGLAIDDASRAAAWRADAMLLAGANGSRLYRNTDGSFAPVDGDGGIADPAPARAAIWLGADVLIGTEEGTRWYRRVGNGDFIESAQAVGLWDPNDTAAIAVADYDGDGLDDVFLANLTGPNRLLRNVGDGTFTHAIDAAHPLMASNAQSTDAAWVALHAGERPSLYVANWDAANHFFVNNQDGTFSEMALEYGIRDPGNTVSVAWGDFLAGQPALALGRWDQQPLLYARRNSAADQPVQPFHDITYSAGVQHIDATLTVRWFDANADGQLDLLAVMANGGVQLYQHTRHPAEDVCYTP